VIKALFDLQDRYKVNLISMLSWSFEFEGKEYFEGFRTLATNGVDKPVLNVFRQPYEDLPSRPTRALTELPNIVQSFGPLRC
jgi:hypothetical protein